MSAYLGLVAASNKKLNSLIVICLPLQGCDCDVLLNTSPVVATTCRAQMNRPPSCILCLDDSKPLTEEHIFPDAAGGGIKIHLLCKECNSLFGSKIDVPYVEQKHIQLARSILKIEGKTGRIPQAFSDIHTISEGDKLIKIKLDSNFKPKIIQQAPNIQISESGSLIFNLQSDISNKKQIPIIISKSMRRFFESDDGKRLGWTKEKQENSIQKIIENSQKLEPKSTKIDTALSGRWTIDLKAIFAEHIKVIYEIASLELGQEFIESPTGKSFREIFKNITKNNEYKWTIEEASAILNITPVLTNELQDLAESLTQNSTQTHHIAVASDKGIFCCMLGMGASFRYDNSKVGARIYVSDIKNKRHGIFDFN